MVCINLAPKKNHCLTSYNAACQELSKTGFKIENGEISEVVTAVTRAATVTCDGCDRDVERKSLRREHCSQGPMLIVDCAIQDQSLIIRRINCWL